MCWKLSNFPVSQGLPGKIPPPIFYMSILINDRFALSTKSSLSLSLSQFYERVKIRTTQLVLYNNFGYINVGNLEKQPISK